MSKQRKSDVKDTNISSKLLGANLSDINIQKFRDLNELRKDRYDLGGKITLPMLKTLTNKFSPDVIFTVTLPGQAISSIDALSDCANLMVLNLSKNNIESLLPLRNLTKLRILNMSGNCVSNVNALEGANQLVNLHLEGNMLKGIDQMRALADCSALRNLSLQTLSGNDPNPICDLADYRRNLLSHLPQLKRLDAIPTVIENFTNGREITPQKTKDLKIDVKTIGPFYCTRFPTIPAYTPPAFKEEQSLKKSIGGCKSSLQELELKVRAMMASQ